MNQQQPIPTQLCNCGTPANLIQSKNGNFYWSCKPCGFFKWVIEKESTNNNFNNNNNGNNNNNQKKNYNNQTPFQPKRPKVQGTKVILEREEESTQFYDNLVANVQTNYQPNPQQNLNQPKPIEQQQR
jgi:hypothetical protein